MLHDVRDAVAGGVDGKVVGGAGEDDRGAVAHVGMMMIFISCGARFCALQMIGYVPWTGRPGMEVRGGL
jgi:hypothetical protein